MTKYQIVLFLRNNKFMERLFKPVKTIIRNHISREAIKHPLRRWDHYHRLYYRKPLDVKNPQTLSEKLCVMEFCTDMSLQTRCTDKVAVREYLTEQGFGKYLNEVYKVFDHMPTLEELDDAMPESCVVKTSNSGGGESVFIIKEKKPDSAKKIYKKLKKAFNDPYGQRTATPHYVGIKPRVLIEKYLPNDEHPDKALNDYKLYCINGEPLFFSCMFNRDVKTHSFRIEYFDLDWKPLDKKTANDKDILPPPPHKDEMIEVARKMAAPFPFVRVDFFEADGRLIFGELTFTPGFGDLISEKGENMLQLGKRLDISKLERIRDFDPQWF